MSCYVYFIEGQGTGKTRPVKVGVARNPEKRLNELQTGNHLELKIKGTIELKNSAEAFKAEKILHRHLRKYGSYGEWFIVNPMRIRKAITQIRRKGLLLEETKNFLYG